MTTSLTGQPSAEVATFIVEDPEAATRRTAVVVVCPVAGSSSMWQHGDFRSAGAGKVRFDQFDDQLSRVKAKASGIYALLVVANVAAWLWALIAFADRPALLGTAFLAYIFGLRHAFDVDHIAAIDNVVRKLMQEGKAPYSAGFFFSLGHSTVVVLASIAIVSSLIYRAKGYDRLPAGQS